MPNSNPPPRCIEARYDIRLNDIGPDGLVRSHILFDYMQDIAAHHAELLGFGMSRLRELGIIWVLSRIRLHVDSYPCYGDTVRVKTWPRGVSRLFATRQYELYSGNTGARLAYASSFWLTLDMKTFRPVNPLSVIKDEIPLNGDMPFFFPDLGKLPSAETSEPVTHEASLSLIDYNRHINNAYYAMFTLDWLGRHYGRRVCFRDIQVNFNTSVPFGKSFECTGKADETGNFTVAGTQSEGHSVFQSAGKADFLD